jgi:hypothetical protein
VAERTQVGNDGVDIVFAQMREGGHARAFSPTQNIAAQKTVRTDAQEFRVGQGRRESRFAYRISLMAGRTVFLVNLTAFFDDCLVRTACGYSKQAHRNQEGDSPHTA